MHGLDGVDDQHLGLLALGGGQNRLDAGLGQHLEPLGRQLQTMGAHRHLRQRFLASDIE